MLGDVFLWLVANLKQGVIYFIKQALPPKHFSRECISLFFLDFYIPFLSVTILLLDYIIVIFHTNCSHIIWSFFFQFCFVFNSIYRWDIQCGLVAKQSRGWSDDWSSWHCVGAEFLNFHLNHCGRHWGRWSQTKNSCANAYGCQYWHLSDQHAGSHDPNWKPGRVWKSLLRSNSTWHVQLGHGYCLVSPWGILVISSYKTCRCNFFNCQRSQYINVWVLSECKYYSREGLVWEKYGN